MLIRRILAIALLLLGTLALVYRGFDYTKETHDAKLGPLELRVKEKDRVEIPTWVGVGLIVAGGALLLINKQK